jgi:hypothetical protein
MATRHPISTEKRGNITLRRTSGIFGLIVDVFYDLSATLAGVRAYMLAGWTAMASLNDLYIRIYLRKED